MNMRSKLIGFALATALVLTGCQGNNNQEGMNQEGTDTNNIQPTRYDENLNRNNRMNERIQNNTQNPNNDINRNQNQRDRYDVSEEAAQRIVDQMDEIDAAYVLTTENNAYVAAVLDNDNNNDNQNNNRGQQGGQTTNDNNLTEDTKQEISDIVRSVDGDIDNVYVSTNPDFVDLTNNYINDFNEGRPIRGLFDQIGDMIERVFPQNRTE